VLSILQCEVKFQELHPSRAGANARSQTVLAGEIPS